MSDFLIFERQIYNRGVDDGVFVKLECDKETPLTGFSPISIEMSESLSIGTPFIELVFNDMEGDYFNRYKIDPTATFTLSIGTKDSYYIRTDMRYSQLKFMNNVAGKSINIAYHITFVHSGWYEMIAKEYNRGWANVKYSDVVQQISSECGFRSVEIAESDKIIESVIQPHWANITMLNWIKKRAWAINRCCSHYEYGITLDNKFFFKSISNLIDEQTAAAINGEIPVFRMEGRYELERKQKEAERENLNNPTYFVSFQGREHYVSSIVNATGGFDVIYYDSKLGEIVRSTRKYSNTKSIQLTDWGSIKKVHENSNMLFYGGRDNETPTRAINQVLNVINSTNDFTIAMVGAPNIHIGDLVEVIIPVMSEGQVDPINTTYSGFYLVAGVDHNVSFTNSSYISTITLSRHGFDGKNLDGYVNSRRGKFVNV